MTAEFFNNFDHMYFSDKAIRWLWIHPFPIENYKEINQEFRKRMLAK